jgi:hypothetical protein
VRSVAEHAISAAANADASSSWTRENVSPFGDRRAMDDDGQAREVRARLARGTASNPASREAQTDADAAGASAAGVVEPGAHGRQLASAPIASNVLTVGPPGEATSEPARTINEAVERLIVATEVDEAVAEWSRGQA